MGRCPDTAVERAMKIQEVLLRAMNGEYSWVQAAAMIGLSGRQAATRRSARLPVSAFWDGRQAITEKRYDRSANLP